MIIHKTAIEGLFVIEPKVFNDSRGYFFESFNSSVFQTLTGLSPAFVQDNESLSTYGVMRGMHFQKEPFSQTKLVHCIEGRVMDIALDLRPGSPTFGRWEAMELSGENHLQLYIPRGFAHGFLTLSEKAVLHYKCDDFYHPEAEAGIDILSLKLSWPIPTEKVIMSEKDRHYPTLEEYRHSL